MLSLKQTLTAFGLIACLTAPPAAAQGQEPGLRLPRVQTLSAGEANLRRGPSLEHPIDYVYQRRGLPVVVIESFDTWRRVRDIDGVEGWMHAAMLSSAEGAIVLETPGEDWQVLRREPAADAAAIARLEPGVIVHIEACDQDWCLVEDAVSAYTGYLPAAALWGADADLAARTTPGFPGMTETTETGAPGNAATTPAN